MTPDGATLQLETLTPLHWIGIAATLVTAGVHLVLGISIGGFFGVLFLFATVGFIGGIAAVVVGWRRKLVYALGIPYTAGQIVLWYALNEPPFPTSHLLDKLSQLVLLVALIVLLLRAR